MIHLPEIISDLAIILMAAAAVTLLFKRLKQPVVLGYIIAGILVGPHFALFPTIGDMPNIQVWAEIGVIFLLFALGLEFSFKKLVRVGGPASITGLTEIVVMLLIGYLTGQLFGWSRMDSMFLGGVLAISSTTIIIRAFEEAEVKGKGFVNLVFGVLIVEDLVAILLLVLLSTIALHHQVEGLEMFSSLFKLGFFLVLWFVAGIFLLPSLLKRFRRYFNEETLLVLSVGLCFLMVVLATKAGFSPALGAFVMGSILAETSMAEKIEHLVQPLKNLFAAIFFVSVGIIIDPYVLWEQAIPVAVITLVTIVGKTLSTAGGALLSGQTLKTSVQSGFSLAQIGEFSFIIAGLGLTLGVTSDFLYPVVVGVSAVTTFTTPYMIRHADGFYDWLDHRLPKRWKLIMANYGSAAQTMSAVSQWPQLMRHYFIIIGINAVLVAAVFLLSLQFVPRVLGVYFESEALARSLTMILALIVSAPFLWSWLFSQPHKPLVQELWGSGRFRAPILAFEASRWVSALALFGFLAPEFFDLKVAVAAIIFLSLGFLLLFSQRLQSIYDWFEKRFVENLSDKQPNLPVIAPWDPHISRLTVSPDSALLGKSLADIGVRENFGVTIALVERGGRLITAPGHQEKLYPFDRLSVLGDDEQVTAFAQEVEKVEVDEAQAAANAADFGLFPLRVEEGSPYIGRRIRDSGLREAAKGLVVGLERRGQRFLNPDATMEIQLEDIVWVVGDTQFKAPSGKTSDTSTEAEHGDRGGQDLDR